MRAKGRKDGRFVSFSGLKKLTPPLGSQYPLLIVDATGLPGDGLLSSTGTLSLAGYN